MDGTTAASLTRTDQAPASAVQQFDGLLRVRFERREGATVLADLHQKPPLRMLFPRVDDPIPLAVCVNTSGGLVGGDRASVEVTAASGTAVTVTAQAAEKVYRSKALDTVIANRLAAQDGAWLEWLPQETIVFDRARLRRAMHIDVEGNARVLAGEILVFGRIARGERVTTGLVRDAWEVRRDGRLIWADALHLDNDIAAVLANAACFGDARAYATMLYAGPDSATLLEALREHGLESGGAATCIGGMLIARWLSPDPAAVRRGFGKAWCYLRQQARGLPASLPRIWHI
ncbi:MAG TPA: urease accessory protein UreD [Alphaproteobacteria bacterium]|nr:urease accessory protein UreD [Alphaproteobacteria bacterium]